jgi:hypothetical protein
MIPLTDNLHVAGYQRFRQLLGSRFLSLPEVEMYHLKAAHVVCPGKAADDESLVFSCRRNKSGMISYEQSHNYSYEINDIFKLFKI